MSIQLNFAPRDARVEVPMDLADRILTDPTDSTLCAELETWCEEPARLMNSRAHGVAFSIGKLRLGEDESRRVSRGIGEALACALRNLGAPRDMRLEIDAVQYTRVPEGSQTRTLLPHHDSAHRSFLTPSCQDDPKWDSHLRAASDTGITQTNTHKLYHGIFIADPGEALSTTSYYNKVSMLRRGYTVASGKEAQTVEEIARWLGDNLRRCLSRREEDQIHYITLAASLGAESRMYRAVPVHWAEADFKPEDLERFSELENFRNGSDGNLAGPTDRLFNQQLMDLLDMDWSELRKTNELCVSSERYDFVMGHNLTLLHGGLIGGPGRLLEPWCMVVDDSSSEDYEKWLANAWRQHWESQQLEG